MDNFKFSIIISAYNSELEISKCITSIIKQTLNFRDNVEIILINEGSKDNTDSICRDFALKFPENINYISKKYEGKGDSRNLGIKYAKGEYIHFLEGDDYLSKNTLKNISCNIYSFFCNYFTQLKKCIIEILTFINKHISEGILRDS